MLLTAGLLNRLRWRCILAGGDLAAAHDRQTTATSRRATRRAVSMAGGASSHPYRSLLGPSPAAAKAPLLREGPPTSPAAASEDRFEKIGTMRGVRGVGVSGSLVLALVASVGSGAERAVQVGSEEQPRWSLPLLPFPSFCFWSIDENAPT
jgi:hypothetical protein